MKVYRPSGRRDRVAHRTLGQRLELLGGSASARVTPYFSYKATKPVCAGSAGRELRAQVAEHLGREARVVLDDREKSRSILAGVHELE